MGRTPRPRYRPDRNLWYAEIDGKRHPLARGAGNEAEATRAFHRIMAERGIAKPEPASAARGQTVAGVCRLFLDYARDELASLTYRSYARHLEAFSRAHATLDAADLRPHHVADWAGSKGWNPTTRHNAITAVKRAFSWAADVGHIPDDPIRKAKRPRPLRREAIPDQGQVEMLLGAIRDRQFRDLVTAIRESGCRPGEVFAMTAARFDARARTWTVANKTRNHGKASRTVYLSDALAELSARLARENPSGPMFRNSRGTAWNNHTVAGRFDGLRKKLGMGSEVTAYALRHLFVTDALERGVPIATVAELVGHKDTAMISRIYSHLSDRTAHLREAARKARGEGPSGDQKP